MSFSQKRLTRAGNALQKEARDDNIKGNSCSGIGIGFGSHFVSLGLCKIGDHSFDGNPDFEGHDIYRDYDVFICGDIDSHAEAHHNFDRPQRYPNCGNQYVWSRII